MVQLCAVQSHSSNSMSYRVCVLPNVSLTVVTTILMRWMPWTKPSKWNTIMITITITSIYSKCFLDLPQRLMMLMLTAACSNSSGQTSQLRITVRNATQLVANVLVEIQCPPSALGAKVIN